MSSKLTAIGYKGPTGREGLAIERERTVNVLNFQSLKDGDDWTPAIQAAVNAAAAAGGGDVFFPNGDYGDLSGVLVPGNVRLTRQSAAGVIATGVTFAEPITTQQAAAQYSSAGALGLPTPGGLHDIWKRAILMATTHPSTLNNVTWRSSTGYVRALNWDGTLSDEVGAGTPASGILVDNWLAAAAPYNAVLPKLVGVVPSSTGTPQGHITFITLPNGTTWVDTANAGEVTHLYGNGTRLATLETAPLTKLQVLSIPNNRLRSLDITMVEDDGTFSTLNAQQNRLETLDISGVVWSDNAGATESAFDVSNNLLTEIRAKDARLAQFWYYPCSLRYNLLSAQALDRFFNDLGPAIVSGQQIANVELDVRDNPGTATCNPSIATAKGYTVITE